VADEKCAYAKIPTASAKPILDDCTRGGQLPGRQHDRSGIGYGDRAVIIQRLDTSLKRSEDAPNGFGTKSRRVSPPLGCDSIPYAESRYVFDLAKRTAVHPCIRQWGDQ
jgi:hypothetical protein